MLDKLIRGTIVLVGLLIGYGVSSGIEALNIINLSDKG